jgi:cation diffusion facilitator family transporter
MLVYRVVQNLRKVSNVLFFALAANVAVALAKTAYGAATGTLSVIADGLHSFTDAASSVMGLVAVHFASRPSDADHHYGHSKYETLAAMSIGMFIGITGLEILRYAVERLTNHIQPIYHASGILVMGIGILLNFLLSRYERIKGEEYKSAILQADSYHTSTDIWVSVSVFISLFLIRYNLSWIDPILSLILVIYFFFVAFRLIRENMMVLSDAAFISPEDIRKIVLGVSGVISCHRIRTRGRPGSAFVDLHIQIDAATRTEEAHKIVHSVEEQLKQEIEGINDVLIHTEPYPDPDDD